MRGDARRALRAIALAIAIVSGSVVAMGGLWYLATASRGLWRLLVASAIGLSVGLFGIGFVRQMGQPISAEEEPTEVPSELGLSYVCEGCGTELSVVRLAKDKPPKHCGEEMVLVRRA